MILHRYVCYGWALLLSLSAVACSKNTPSTDGTTPSERSLSAGEQTLLDQLNALRRTHKRPALTTHAGLTRVAREHSQDMQQRMQVSHVSPLSGTPAQRVERAGYRSGLVLENVGRGPDLDHLHELLLKSPGHRSNMLNPDVTHVGIGVQADESDEPISFYVTQLFARMAPNIDAATAPQQLLTRINEVRRSRGAEPVREDAILKKAAQEGTQHFFEDPSYSQQDIVEDASRDLRRFALAYQRVGGVMAVVSHLDEAATLEPVLDPTIHAVGIGITQGNRPDVISNAIAIVIMFAWSR